MMVVVKQSSTTGGHGWPVSLVASLNSRGFSHQVFDPRTVHAACMQADHRWRRRLLDPVTTLRLFMLQILHGNVACRTVRHLAGMSFSLTAYGNARMRLPVQLFAQLAWTLTGVARGAHNAFGRWRDHRVLLIDGSGLSMPDTPALQRRLGQPGRVRIGCGFPVMHVLWLFDAATGLIVDPVHNRGCSCSCTTWSA